MKSFKNFLKSLFSSEPGSVSSKRFVGVLAFLTICFAAVMDILFHKTISEFIFFGLLGIVGAVFGLNTLLTSKSIDARASVASDIISKDPIDEVTAESAKDIM